MPVNNGKQAANGQKKKKKGRAPAHQNTFAFSHNPKSKTTAKILNLPIKHCCRRCVDKLEWRKKYRKYKPRTQPGACNICQQKRVVLAAYHTICEKCTVTDKAHKCVRENLGITTTADTDAQPEQEQSTTATKRQRACAMCVKDFALDDPDDEDDEGDILYRNGKRLTLRQRKTLERQRANKDNPARAKEDDDESESEEDEPMAEVPQQLETTMEEDDEEDPFLKAVGGCDKLLTGEAYQQSLLQKEQEMQA